MSRSLFSDSDKQFISQFSKVVIALHVFAACLLALACYIYSLQPSKTDVHYVARINNQRLAPVADVYARKPAATKAASSKTAHGTSTKATGQDNQHPAAAASTSSQSTHP